MCRRRFGDSRRRRSCPAARAVARRLRRPGGAARRGRRPAEDSRLRRPSRGSDPPPRRPAAWKAGGVAPACDPCSSRPCRRDGALRQVGLQGVSRERRGLGRRLQKARERDPSDWEKPKAPEKQDAQPKRQQSRDGAPEAAHLDLSPSGRILQHRGSAGRWHVDAAQIDAPRRFRGGDVGGQRTHLIDYRPKDRDSLATKVDISKHSPGITSPSHTPATENSRCATTPPFWPQPQPGPSDSSRKNRLDAWGA